MYTKIVRDEFYAKTFKISMPIRLKGIDLKQFVKNHIETKTIESHSDIQNFESDNFDELFIGSTLRDDLNDAWNKNDGIAEGFEKRYGFIFSKE